MENARAQRSSLRYDGLGMDVGSDSLRTGLHHGFGTDKLIAACTARWKKNLTLSHDLRISELESRRCAVSPRKTPKPAQNRLCFSASPNPNPSIRRELLHRSVIVIESYSQSSGAIAANNNTMRQKMQYSKKQR